MKKLVCTVSLSLVSAALLATQTFAATTGSVPFELINQISGSHAENLYAISGGQPSIAPDNADYMTYTPGEVRDYGVWCVAKNSEKLSDNCDAAYYKDAFVHIRSLGNTLYFQLQNEPKQKYTLRFASKDVSDESDCALHLDAVDNAESYVCHIKPGNHSILYFYVEPNA